jgi:hypothetical protein
MVKLVINLRNKNIFFFLSFLGLIFMFYQITFITSSIDIKYFDIFILFLSMIFSAAMFWIPYQFNDKFI